MGRTYNTQLYVIRIEKRVGLSGAFLGYISKATKSQDRVVAAAVQNMVLIHTAFKAELSF